MISIKHLVPMIHNLFILRRLFFSALTFFALVSSGHAEPEGAFLSRLNDLYEEDSWYLSEYAVERESFRAAWKRSAVSRAPDGGINLFLVPAPAEAQKDFIGAEIQRSRRTHFGRYEVVMTAARGEGVISSFFTYTGAYFGDAHEEIDFEFLGVDTTKVWLNRFVDGQKLPGRWIELGFDAADGPHLYTLDWLPDRLIWSVDGRELMRVTDKETTIPQTPQRIYISIWAGGPRQRGWSGNAPDDMRAHAQYDCISYRPPASEAPMCSQDTLPKEIGND
jgi:endo-1,3-1,4-beta-glycanase ExoK